MVIDILKLQDMSNRMEPRGADLTELLFTLRNADKCGNIEETVQILSAQKKLKPVLYLAARDGLLNVVIYLIDNGADVHLVDRCGYNILHHFLCSLRLKDVRAVDEDKYVQIIQTLINLGVAVNQSNDEGNTPLFYVVHKQGSVHKPKKEDEFAILKIKLIQLLIENGCNVNHRNKEGKSLLMFFLERQADIRLINLLTLQGSDVNLVDNNGETACSYCVKHHFSDCYNIFILLVDSGAELFSAKNGIKLLRQILRYKRRDVFLYYLGFKMVIKGTTDEEENMLHLLARVNFNYSLDKFNYLFNNELDINHPCSNTNTPTMIAALLLNSKYLALFTRHPELNINAQNNQGHTALHLCIIGFSMYKNGLNERQLYDVVRNYCRQIYPIYMECVDILLGAVGIDVNLKDIGGRTVLMMAAMKNDRVMIKKLLKAGAMVNIINSSGKSALQYLDIYKNVFDLACFKLLISNGNRDILNLPCVDGNTIIQAALCFPIFWTPRDVVRFIRYLVAENASLQTLVTSSVKCSYKQISVDELNIKERDELRKLLYLSGAPKEEIISVMDFDADDKSAYHDEAMSSRHKERLNIFHNNLSLKSRCRRIIRQNLVWGLQKLVTYLERHPALNQFLRLTDIRVPDDCHPYAFDRDASNVGDTLSLKALCRKHIRHNLVFGIQEKVKELDLPRELNDFLLLKDVLHPKDYNVFNIDDGCNDDDDNDYDGYDIDKDRDDDYSQYNYQYCALYNDDELLEEFKIFKVQLEDDYGD
ncbi:putative ankyrin repeat protein RF_0381 [Patella vulgata]|uniref:putative ankyrin repeat protein RF_0381 n=1 Tax=Patella vulgata TaxID=6465 RepID=UPI0021801FB3|nr:putative ankyrin repeat protein RF_0381 [Patella vulgata]